MTAFLEVIVYRTDKRTAWTPIERVTAMDLTVLASDRGSMPMNICAMLEFEPTHGPSLAEVHQLLTERLTAIPRLRQRLHRTRPGGARHRRPLCMPLWSPTPQVAGWLSSWCFIRCWLRA